MPVVNVTCANDKKKLALIPSGCQVIVRNPGKSYVEFFCTLCRCYQTMDLPEELVSTLRALGVSIKILDIPDEFDEPHSGGPITRDELYEFSLALWATEEMVMPPARRPHLFRH